MNHLLRSAAPRLTALRAADAAAAFFHSTPVLERKRKTYWSSGCGSFSPKRFNYYGRRTRKLDSKKILLRNISEYAEHLFQSWRDEDDRCNSSSREDLSWFRQQFCGRKESSFAHRHIRKPVFEFCSSDEDDEAEIIFQSIFGGQRHSFDSFNIQWRNSSCHSNWRGSSDWRYITDDDDEKDDRSGYDLVSERRALGLNPFGPLKLEEVKTAYFLHLRYRACALKWHPDRHLGSSKVSAEEKFKHCTAAYKLLCDSLVPT